jgi:trans-aconitate 2-methyltransferase
MAPWNPDHYLRFGDQRTRAAIDLASSVRVDDPQRVVDLGCGPGNSTEVLRRRWPRARLLGLDSSAEMVASARAARPEGEWALGRIEDWTAGEPWDVVFSNAALQWTRDHATLVRRLFGAVAPGGALAFQIPSGAYSPVRTLIREVASDSAWAERMDEARRALTMEEPAVYYDALAPVARDVDIWETEYHHVMASAAAIVDWMSSTGLRPYLAALASDEERRRFVSMLTERVTASYTRRSDGRVLFPFRRLFVVAYATP